MTATMAQCWPALVARALAPGFTGTGWPGALERPLAPMLIERPERLQVAGGLFEPVEGTGDLLRRARGGAADLGAVAGSSSGPMPAMGVLALEVRTAWIMAVPALVFLGVDNPATVHAVALTPGGLANQRTGEHALARVLRRFGPWPLLAPLGSEAGEDATFGTHAS